MLGLIPQLRIFEVWLLTFARIRLNGEVSCMSLLVLRA